MASKLVELREKMDYKQTEIMKLLESKPDRDFSQQELDFLDQTNKELNELGPQWEKLRDIDRINVAASRQPPVDRLEHPIFERRRQASIGDWRQGICRIESGCERHRRSLRRFSPRLYEPCAVPPQAILPER